MRLSCLILAIALPALSACGKSPEQAPAEPDSQAAPEQAPAPAPEEAAAPAAEGADPAAIDAAIAPAVALQHIRQCPQRAGTAQRRHALRSRPAPTGAQVGTGSAMGAIEMFGAERAAGKMLQLRNTTDGHAGQLLDALAVAQRQFGAAGAVQQHQQGAL